MDAITEREEYKKIISKNIEFDFVSQNYSLSEAEGILDTMLEAVCSKKDYLRVKEEYPDIKRIYVRAEFPYINDDYKNYLLKSYEDTYYPEKN